MPRYKSPPDDVCDTNEEVDAYYEQLEDWDAEHEPDTE